MNICANKYNVRYYSDENPHTFRRHTQFPEKLNEYAEILSAAIVDPIFTDRTLNGGKYLNLAGNVIHPLIAKKHK